MQRRNIDQRSVCGMIKRSTKSSKWITNGILKSINTKDRMYKKLLRAKISNSESYATLKAELKAYQSSLPVALKKRNAYIILKYLTCIITI